MLPAAARTRIDPVSYPRIRPDRQRSRMSHRPFGIPLICMPCQGFALWLHCGCADLHLSCTEEIPFASRVHHSLPDLHCGCITNAWETGLIAGGIEAWKAVHSSKGVMPDDLPR